MIKTEAKLKKFYSVMSNAIDKSVLDNGDWSTWDYSLSAVDFYNTYFKDQLSIAKIDTSQSYTNNIYLVLSDGTCAYLRKNSSESRFRNYFIGISVNCKSRHANEGRKVFELGLYNFKKSNILCNYGPTGCGFIGDIDFRQDFVSNYDKAYCNIGNRGWKSYECYMKFIQDGMQFKDDYNFYKHDGAVKESGKYW